MFESRRDQSFSFRDPHFKNFIDILLQDFIYARHQMMDASLKSSYWVSNPTTPSVDLSPNLENGRDPLKDLARLDAQVL